MTLAVHILGVMTCYLVITGLATVSRPAGWSPRLDVGLMLLVTMFYWLWRVRIRRSFRGIVRVTAAEAA